ncbi:hypothetical protein [Glaciimonas sp. PCH181]|uniref:hypothetical protein n=1 Tax=Glaciimonas sp. PCH181 TaxID=2133943 RepID=UPI0011B20CD1|nr:hypothetical protein [Glaciimonas sp. PCH181]
MSSQDWAAWVQAVGSIAAIGAAIWISRHQQNIVRQRDEDNAVLTLHLLNHEAMQFAINLNDQIESAPGSPVIFDVAAFNEMRSSLGKIPLRCLDPTLLTCLFRLKDILAHVFQRFHGREVWVTEDAGQSDKHWLLEMRRVMMRIAEQSSSVMIKKNISELVWVDLDDTH